MRHVAVVIGTLALVVGACSGDDPGAGRGRPVAADGTGSGPTDTAGGQDPGTPIGGGDCDVYDAFVSDPSPDNAARLLDALGDELPAEVRDTVRATAFGESVPIDAVVDHFGPACDRDAGAGGENFSFDDTTSDEATVDDDNDDDTTSSG